MKKLYPRICSSCGRRFRGKKMDAHCKRCREVARIWVERRELRDSELGQIMRTEWRGQRIIGCSAVAHIRHNS